MNNKFGFILFSIGLVICLSLTLWNTYRMPKIAYVRSHKVVEGFMGMKEATSLYQNKVSSWQSSIDTLNTRFNIAFENYKKESPKLGAKERKAQEEKLDIQRTQLLEYKQQLEVKAKEENEKLTQGALNQINSYVEEYAKDKGYNVVLGVTLAGNVLYAEDAIDITEEVLEGLNDSYKK